MRTEMGLVGRTVKSTFNLCLWKLRYGGKIRADFPLGLEGVRIEIDKGARVDLQKKIQNRGTLFIGCKGEGRLEIGSHCFFNVNASVTCVKRITIGKYCKFGNNLVIVDHDHDFNNSGDEFPGEPIEIGNHVWVGANCVILKGVRIGDHAVIAAGSVVRRDVPANSVYYEKREPIVICK